ncbi:MAG: hypothetical protein HZC18_08605 [Candidatus Omnitrophica bacterium]|nr:hypothetical protein [Candidatus Omnitrophota bacterium]
MKNRALLIAAVFLILGTPSFGADVSHNSTSIKTSDKADYRPDFQKIPTEWRSCSTDSDCIAGLVGCWYWEPVNKKYIEEFYNKKTLASVCRRSIDPGFQPVTACIEKECKLTDKSTQITMDDWRGAMQKSNAQ